MSGLVIYGKAIDALGIATSTSLVQGRDRPELHRSFRSYDARELRARQPRGPLRLEHDRVIGQIVGVEVAPDGATWITAVADTGHLELLRGTEPWYFSVETEALARGDARLDVEITGVGVVRTPAFGRAVLRPVRLLPGDLASERARRSWRLGDVHGGRLDRAARSLNQRDLVVHRAAVMSGRTARGDYPDAPPTHGWIDPDGRPLSHAIGARLGADPSYAVR